MVRRNPTRNTYNNPNNRKQYFRLLAWIRRDRNSNQINTKITQADNNQISGETNRNKRDVKWTDIAQVLLTLIMIIVTYYLFTESQKQTTNAVGAINQAKISNGIAAKNNELAAKAFESGNEDTKKRFRIDSATLKAQIDNLTASQKQFEIGNRPFVQISNINIDTLLPWKKVSLSFTVNNFGKLPAKMVTGMYNIEAGAKGADEKIIDSIMPFVKFNMNDSSNNLIVSGNAVIKQIFKTRWVMTEWKHSEILAGRMFIYFMGEIEYVNFITKKRYINKFLYKINIYPLNIIAIQNDDKEL